MIDRISINGTMYAVTPVPEGEQPSGSTVTVDGVTYLIGTAITAPAEMAQQAIEKIQVNGVLYDIADVEAVKAETLRATEAERMLVDAINTNANNLAETEKNIANQLVVTPAADKVAITGCNEQSMRLNFGADIPAATAEKAGVMSAEDKKNVNASIKNIDVSPNSGDVELDLEDNTGRVLHVVFPEATSERAGVMTAEDKKEQVKKTPLLNGDTIVGLAREVYSRQGKVDTTTFLKRTTAGGTSVSDGVASIRQIGGNILKNIVDGEFEGAIVNRATASYNNGVCKIVTDKTEATSLYGDLSYGYELIAGHTYYSCLQIYNVDCKDVRVSINGGYEAAQSDEKNKWVFLSYHGIPREYSVKLAKIRAYNNREADENNMYGGNTCFVKNWFAIDLTEMFGAGNEPTKEECDRMFACMGALPQGLTIAQPTGLKSIGYNQWNPANVLLNKSIVENAIEDDVADRHIAIVECLPCKTGTGENNGYVIGYGEGDAWSDEGIEVYLTPLNPMEVDGELYLQKLDKEATYGTYVPQIKGNLLVVTPTTDKLCAHFHWSGDRAATDYEPYVESNVALPTIPEMSEWGLAGISTSGTMVQDTIDLENNTYTKRVGCVDLGTLTWEKVEVPWNVYVCGEKKIYNPARLSKMYTYPTLDFNDLNRLSVSYNESDDSITISATKGDIIAGETYTMAGQVVISRIDCKQPIAVKPTSDRYCGNVLCVKYNTITRGQCYYGTSMNGVGVTNTGCVSIVDSAFTGMTESEIKASLDGILLYYEMITPEEYPIVTKAAPNYIGSDYGVEEFMGSKVPLAANILFYMRSLVSETRNFLDRLMARLGISDATAVADKIADAIIPTTEETDVEPTEVIEE